MTATTHRLFAIPASQLHHCLRYFVAPKLQTDYFRNSASDFRRRKVESLCQWYRISLYHYIGATHLLFVFAAA
jgi:hypothetical protein